MHTSMLKLPSCLIMNTTKIMRISLPQRRQIGYSHSWSHIILKVLKTHSTIDNLHELIQLQPQVQDTPCTLTQACHMTYMCVLCTGNNYHETILAWWRPLSCMLIHTYLTTDTRPCRLQRILVRPLPLLLLWNLLLPWKMRLFQSFCLKKNLKRDHLAIFK